MRTIFSKLFVPILQILVGNFTVGVKNEYANMGAVIVSGMQLVE